MATSWVDTHVHIDRYTEGERAELLERADAAGVAVVGVAVDLESSCALLAIPGLAGVIVGVHPKNITSAEVPALAELATRAPVIAIGECGFDATGPSDELQAAAFRYQADLALRFNLPLVLHIDGEGAWENLMAQAHALQGLTVIRHYFTGTAEQAEWHRTQGHYLSFGRPLRREPALREICLGYPSSLLLLETDSYPLRARTTEPRDVRGIGETIALLCGWTFAQASEQFLKNTREAFPGIDFPATT